MKSYIIVIIILITSCRDMYPTRKFAGELSAVNNKVEFQSSSAIEGIAFLPKFNLTNDDSYSFEITFSKEGKSISKESFNISKKDIRSSSSDLKGDFHAHYAKIYNKSGDTHRITIKYIAPVASKTFEIYYKNYDKPPSKNKD